MPYIGSKIFGPTDSVADTLTALAPTAGWVAAKDYNCTQIRVGKGNVVNAKESAGFIHVEVTGVGYFAFAYGNGAGGATNSNNMSAEPINCSIPIPKGATVTVRILDAEAAKDVTACLLLNTGSGFMQQSLAAGGAGQDTTADTELTLTVNTKLTNIKMTPTRSGQIREIRIAGSGVVDAKAGTGKLVLDVGTYEHPLEFAFGMGSGGAATSSTDWADVISNLAIPVSANIPVVAKVTTAEVMLSVSVSLTVM